MTVIDVPRSRGLLRRGGPRPDVGDLGWDGTSWRRWSGKRWAKPVYSLQRELLVREPDPSTWPRLTADRLDRGLQLAVDRQVSENAALVDHTGRNGVVLSYRRPVSHVVHAILSVLTAGLWFVVWILMSLNRRYDRVRLEIDSWGHVWAVPLRSRD